MSLDFVCGVPQDSVLGPVSFILYITPLTCLIEKHSVRHEMFADDIPLNHSESPESYLVCSLQGCVKDIGLWIKKEKRKKKTTHTEKMIRPKLFVSHHHLLSTRPCHTHRQSLSAIPMLNFLEPSAISASSLIAIFQ